MQSVYTVVYKHLSLLIVKEPVFLLVAGKGFANWNFSSIDGHRSQLMALKASLSS